MIHYHYIIVRRDLPFGVTLAQTAHAASESGRIVPLQQEKDTVAVLGVRNEKELLRWHKKLLRKGIRHVAVYEPDAPWLGQLMAIGLAPGPRIGMGHTLRKLQTYRDFKESTQPNHEQNNPTVTTGTGTGTFNQSEGCVQHLELP